MTTTYATPTLNGYCVDSKRLGKACRIALASALLGMASQESKPMIVRFSNCESSHVRTGFLVWSYCELAYWCEKPWAIVAKCNELLGTSLDTEKVLRALIAIRNDPKLSGLITTPFQDVE